ncbi:MAG TPA: hypothetical protein DCS63_04990 [Elusimicrobia bacterium]|nr:hypothetical protein [Elusimicrobiota bacterium]
MYYYRYPGSAYGDQLSFYDNETLVYALPYTYTSWRQKAYAIPAGSHSLKWNYYDGNGGSVTAIDCVSVSNSQPSLLWTGETNYSASGVQPPVDFANNSFAFRVKYIDTEGDAPASGYPKLHVMKDGAEILGSPFTMSIVYGAHDTGAIYNYTLALTSIGTDYTYYFEAQDIFGGVAANFPSAPKAGPGVYKALINWTGETGYMTGGVNPESGDRNASYIYRIKFSDSDNVAPAAGFPKLHIKQGGAEISGSPFTMNYVSGAYNTGAIYSYTKNLMPGTNYTYYFEAQDAVAASAGGSPTTEISAPSVSNQLPGLAWTGETNYLNDGVCPKVASSSTPSIFRAKYSDPDNDAPAAGYPKLYVKKGGAQAPGSPFLLTCAGTDYIGGVICNLSEVLGSGEYSYRFEAFDIYNGLASGAPANEAGGLVSIGTDLPAAQEVKVYHGVFKPGQDEKTNISFNTPAPAAVTVTVYNNIGRKVKELYRGGSSTGLNLIQWDGRDDAGARVSSGVYTIKIEGGGINQSKRVVVVR